MKIEPALCPAMRRSVRPPSFCVLLPGDSSGHAGSLRSCRWTPRPARGSSCRDRSPTARPPAHWSLPHRPAANLPATPAGQQRRAAPRRSRGRTPMAGSGSGCTCPSTRRSLRRPANPKSPRVADDQLYIWHPTAGLTPFAGKRISRGCRLASGLPTRPADWLGGPSPASPSTTAYSRSPPRRFPPLRQLMETVRGDIGQQVDQLFQLPAQPRRRPAWRACGDGT